MRAKILELLKKTDRDPNELQMNKGIADIGYFRYYRPPFSELLEAAIRQHLESQKKPLNIRGGFNWGKLKLSKIMLYLGGLLLLFTLSTFTAKASALIPLNAPTGITAANMTKEQKEARMVEMKERVKEIKAMDKSQMTKEQRKALRMELKNMNHEARNMGYNGVYISVGALIIIILLLIIILH